MDGALDFLGLLACAFICGCGLIGAIAGWFVFKKRRQPRHRGLLLGFFTGIIVGMILLVLIPLAYLYIRQA